MSILLISMLFYIMFLVALIIFIEISELLERDDSNANAILLFGSGLFLTLTAFVFVASFYVYFTNF